MHQSVIFLHIPRSGGTTLSYIIEREYPPQSVVRLYDSDFGEELADILPSEADRPRAILGHFYFGAHTFMSEPATYITFLRDPIDRALSEYSYVRQSPSHPHYESVRGMTLKDFVEFCSDNNQTRQLAGKCGVPSLKTPPDELLNTAKTNLAEHFTVVGLTEEFDRSVILMKRSLGWSQPFYAIQNKTRSASAKDELPQEDLDVICAYNELDLELHRFGKMLLQEQSRAQGPDFESEVRKFKTLNAAYSGFCHTVSVARRTMSGPWRKLVTRRRGAVGTS